ncbi:hypothetical protein HanXRQr2_Chr13g0585261 [Helianthus annuus]|uniref:Uncharacterized protein n=1 Tax=Helianthus annuus TaxID=4232 RepID=A0A9K3EH32_HELAN|nr:hypothetical protein HanXRQr2_Chr13g0585261 [Helianthus annuus]KAJ0848959.1 hypothetical protein HanPSC8_Chr13g0563461 [Helianthus annuus]
MLLMSKAFWKSYKHTTLLKAWQAAKLAEIQTELRQIALAPVGSGNNNTGHQTVNIQEKH